MNVWHLKHLRFSKPKNELTATKYSTRYQNQCSIPWIPLGVDGTEGEHRGQLWTAPPEMFFFEMFFSLQIFNWSLPGHSRTPRCLGSSSPGKSRSADHSTEELKKRQKSKQAIFCTSIHPQLVVGAISGWFWILVILGVVILIASSPAWPYLAGGSIEG